MMLTFLELAHMAQTYRCQNTTRLSERTSKIFEDLNQNAKTQVVSAFTKIRTFVKKHNRMALTKREYQWNCAEKSRAAA